MSNFSVRLYTPAWYVVSRGAGETQIHARPAAKTYSSDCRIGKLYGYHKKPGILSLFLAYGGLGGIVFWCSCLHGFESLSLCLRNAPWKRAIVPWSSGFPQARLEWTSLNTLLESMLDQDWQKLARRTAARALFRDLPPVELYLHLRGFT